MRKFLSLTHVMLKNSMGMLTDSKTKKISAMLLYGFLALCLLPITITLFVTFKGAMESLIAVDQAGAVLAVAMHLSSFVIFIFSIFLIPGIFYFSRDGETLLAYPIKPHVILGSKFVVAMVYEYVFAFIVLAPAFLAYTQVTTVSLLYYLFAVIIFLMTPIYPLILSSIITMLIMRFVPFFKNRDRFNMVAGIVSVVLGLSLSFTLNPSAMGEDPTALVTSLMSGDNSLIEIFGYFFPSIPFAARSLVQGNILTMLVMLGITILAILVFLNFGKYVYFKGVIGFNETGSCRKKLSSSDLTKLNRQRNRISTYVWKEMRLLIRTPVYFLNCIASCAIIPIMMYVVTITGDAANMTELLPKSFAADVQPFLPYALAAGLVIGIFLSNMNLISATAISREGANVMFMKYIPMPLNQQIHAKVYSGILISICSSLLTILSGYVIFPYLPIIFYILAFLGTLITIILGNYLGIIIDILHPKLVWEQEAAAVKQNISGMIAMFGCMALAVAVGFLIYLIPSSHLLLCTIGIALVLIILCGVLYTYVGTIAQHAFKKY